MIIGTSSYSFHQYISKGEMSQADAILKAKQLGFEAIEFTELMPENGMSKIEYAKYLKNLAKENDMLISAYAVCGNVALKDKEKLEEEISRLKDCVDVAYELGAKFMRHDVMSSYNDFSSFDAALDTIAYAARIVTEYAKQKGIVTLIENHGQICQDPDRIERLIDKVNHENYGLLLDTGNFLCADVSPVYAASRLAHFVKMVHLKDAKVIPFGTPTEYNLYETRGCNKLDFVVPCTGDANIEQVFAILKKAGFDGHVDVEYEGREDSVEALGKTIENLKNIL